MKPSSAAKRISRTQARNAAMLNLLATPGLGSLAARQWAAGAGQLALALAGFGCFVVWFLKLMFQFYGQISGTAEASPQGQLGLWGAGLFGLAWVWSLVTSISLWREAAQASLESVKSFGGSQLKLADEETLRALAALPQWQRNGTSISRRFEFADFPAAMAFVNAVAVLAEQARHHPDMDVRWNQVTLALTTHDAGGLTEMDFAMARQCDALAAGR